MDRREKQRKFHQAVIDMLYLPPPPRQHIDEVESDSMITVSEFDVNLINDSEVLDSTSSSSADNDEDGDPGPRKLTRAQRKRLRKKKLKQTSSAGSQRRKIIGPLLPSAVNNQNGDIAAENQSQNTIPAANDDDNGRPGENRLHGVRQNANENQSGNAAPDLLECNAQKEGKLKRRRVAKKLARENTKPSHGKDGECANEFR